MRKDFSISIRRPWKLYRTLNDLGSLKDTHLSFNYIGSLKYTHLLTKTLQSTRILLFPKQVITSCINEGNDIISRTSNLCCGISTCQTIKYKSLRRNFLPLDHLSTLKNDLETLVVLRDFQRYTIWLYSNKYYFGRNIYKRITLLYGHDFFEVKNLSDRIFLTTWQTCLVCPPHVVHTCDYDCLWPWFETNCHSRPTSHSWSSLIVIRDKLLLATNRHCRMS